MTRSGVLLVGLWGRLGFAESTEGAASRAAAVGAEGRRTRAGKTLTRPRREVGEEGRTIAEQVLGTSPSWWQMSTVEPGPNCLQESSD
jgi:hypothetical protein